MPVYDLLNKVSLAKEFGFLHVTGATTNVLQSYRSDAGRRGFEPPPDTVKFIYPNIKSNTPAMAEAAKAIMAALGENGKYSRYKNRVNINDDTGELAITMNRDAFEQAFQEEGKGIKIRLGISRFDAVNVLERHKVDVSFAGKFLRAEVDPRRRQVVLFYSAKGTRLADADAALLKKIPEFKANKGTTFMNGDEYAMAMSFSHYKELTGREVDFGGRIIT